jgi:hypothetical protein
MLPEGSGGRADSNDDSPDMFADCSLQDEESSSVVKLQIEGKFSVEFLQSDKTMYITCYITIIDIWLPLS